MITDLDELGALLDARRRTLFRLETLDVYTVASDRSDYRRYLDGEPEPEWEVHYDDAGRFLGGEALPETQTPRYVAARGAAWAAAIPFEPWWAARPQYHRSAGWVG